MMWIEFLEITLFLMSAWILLLITTLLLPKRIITSGIKRRFSQATLVAVILGYLLIYWWLPSLALPNVIFTITTIGVIGAGIFLLLFGADTITDSLANGRFSRFFNESSTQGRHDVTNHQTKRGRSLKLGLWWIVACLVIGIGTWLGASAMSLDVHQMVNSIPTTIKSNSKSAPMPVLKSNEDLPVVNAPATVRADMNNSLNSFKNSNVYDLDHLRVQMYHGKMVYVAPVEFDGGFFRYLNYRKTPGYFMVSATDKSATPKFVNRPMTYTPSAYFNSDAIRRIYAQSIGYYMSKSAPQLEIDEHGTPYYVKTLTRRFDWSFNTNFSKYKVAVLNAVTGQVKVYNRKDVPSFVDVSVEPNYVAKEVEAFGHYRNGFWNASIIGGHRQVMKSAGHGTEGTNDSLTPYAYKGRIYYFTGMTSWSEKQTTLLGYVFVDAHTNEFKYFQEKGSIMTPGRAISYAEQDINPQNYKGTIPLLYRVNGQPTWVISMLDGKNYSFMKYVYLLANGSNQAGTFAIGTNAKDTLTSLTQNMQSGAGTITDSSKRVTKSTRGTIFRFAATSDGQYWFMLKGDPHVYNLNPKDTGFAASARLVQSGDRVSFKYQQPTTKTGVAAVDAASFKDDELNQNQSR
ncbi:hypothetical protein [Levilactobacillus bambusae]|uniref:Uncharacterized protein n=1 Tax=Levilactobacillus bambusae TaxID=2024736 RepID=A0A2V1MZI9_9LACO|nr:hypothetical protein [Levilactobacillus bambusae]PWG00431.1 hypothetical protein DCM90_05770 [Levilactobacillus bambusae]